jgi:hypothetical protein
MAAPALEKEGVDGRVNHPIKSGDGHDGAGGWVIGHDGSYECHRKS